MAKRDKIPQVPIHGKAAHNTAFLTAIGGLVVNWANNESVFLALLQSLIIGGDYSASIVWHSHQNTRARLELVAKLCRERISDPDLLARITAAIKQFVGHTRTRNFYCHALYRYDSDLCLHDATSTTMPQEGEPIAYESRSMNLATLNEIGDVSKKLALFNQELWKIVADVQDALGVQRAVPPPLRPAPTENPDDQDHQDTGGRHEGPP